MGRKPVIRSEAEKRNIKIESRKRHQRGLRRAMAVSDYLLLTATDQHRQATAFVEQLEEKYPGKRDVRKTPEFRVWQQKQLLWTSLATDQTPATNCEKETATINPEKEMVLRTSLATDQTPATSCEKETATINPEKEMVLRIPLMQTDTKATPSVPDMPGETQEQEDQLISIFEEIPNDVMNEMMAEIRADPDLSAIMNDFCVNEEVLDEGTVPEMDIDLDIDLDICPLEDEINSLLYF